MNDNTGFEWTSSRKCQCRIPIHPPSSATAKLCASPLPQATSMMWYPRKPFTNTGTRWSSLLPKSKDKNKFRMDKNNLNIENAKAQFLSKYLWVLIWRFGSHSNIQRTLWDHRLLNKTSFLSWTVVVSTGQLFIALLTTPQPFSVSNRYNTGLSWMSFTSTRTHKVLYYFNFYYYRALAFHSCLGPKCRALLQMLQQHCDYFRKQSGWLACQQDQWSGLARHRN